MVDMSKIENNSSDHVEEAHIAKPRSEKRLVLKQDLIILPLLSGAFFFAYLVFTLRWTTESYNLLTML